MSERPILFSGPMVRAILEGRKSQTRRVVKPQPTHRLIDGLAHVTVGMDPALDGAVWYDADCINPGREVRCPYGRVGDILWVREAWSIEDQDGGGEDYAVAYEADGPEGACSWFTVAGTPLEKRYGEGFNIGLFTGRKRPSIHMPRAFSRITLEVKAVRVERVQDGISDEDALAEGIESLGWDYAESGEDPSSRFCYWNQMRSRPPGNLTSCETAQDVFRNLWDSINGQSHPWASNPWVWVVEFERV